MAFITNKYQGNLRVASQCHPIQEARLYQGLISWGVGIAEWGNHVHPTTANQPPRGTMVTTDFRQLTLIATGFSCEPAFFVGEGLRFKRFGRFAKRTNHIYLIFIITTHFFRSRANQRNCRDEPLSSFAAIQTQRVCYYLPAIATLGHQGTRTQTA